MSVAEAKAGAVGGGPAEAGSPQAEIVEFAPEYLEGVLRLWGRHFGEWSRGRLERRWVWQFPANPWIRERPQRIVLAVDPRRGEVVGHLSSLPLPLRYGGVTRPTLCAAGLVVEEPYRMVTFALMRRILTQAPAMATGMHDSVRKIVVSMGHQIVPLSRRRFTLKLSDAGERTRRFRQRLRRPLVPLARPWMARMVPGGMRGSFDRVRAARARASGVVVEPLRAFGAEYDELWSRVSAGIPCTIERDSRYMSWRYLECPVQRSAILGVREGGRLVGVCSGTYRTELDWTNCPCVNFGEVTSLIVEEGREDVARALLSEMVLQLSWGGIDGVSTLGLQLKWHGILRELGFEEEDAEAWAMSVLPAPRGQFDVSMLKEEYWMCSAADGDSLFAATIS